MPKSGSTEVQIFRSSDYRDVDGTGILAGLIKRINFRDPTVYLLICFYYFDSFVFFKYRNNSKLSTLIFLVNLVLLCLSRTVNVSMISLYKKINMPCCFGLDESFVFTFWTVPICIICSLFIAYLFHKCIARELQDRSKRERIITEFKVKKVVWDTLK